MQEKQPATRDAGSENEEKRETKSARAHTSTQPCMFVYRICDLFGTFLVAYLGSP
jgi:hypothetical protein